MAATDARPIAKKNLAYRLYFTIFDADGDPVAGVAFDSGLGSGSGKVILSKDGATAVNSTNSVTEITSGGGLYFIDLTSGEMNFDCVSGLAKPDAAGLGAGYKSTPFFLYPEEDGDIRANVTQWIGTAPSALVAGRVDASVGTMAAGVVTAAAIATDAIDGDAIAASAVTEIQSGLATSAALATVQADTDDIQTRLPAALVAGRMDASVGAMAANTLTATAIAADAITAAKLAADVTTELQAGLATSAALATVQADTDDIQARLTTVQADTDDIQARLPAALVSGRMDASVGAMAASVMTASALAADAVAEIADGVWDETQSGHTAAGTYGRSLQIIRDGTAQAGAAGSISLDAGASGVDDFYNNNILTIISGTGVGQARIISDYVGATKVATVNDNWRTNPDSTSVFVILPFGSIPGAVAPTAAQVADAVWDETRTDHTTAGTFGRSLQIVRDGTAQTGTASTISLDASASGVDDFYNSAIIAIVGGTGIGQARIISDYVGATKVASVNDNWKTNPDATSVFIILPFGSIPGAVAPTAAQVAVAVWDETLAAHVGAGTVGANQNLIDNINADTDDIQARLPATLTAGGKMRSDAEASNGTAIVALTSGGYIQADVARWNSSAGPPNGLVSGRVDASVGAIAANAITSAVIATDAIGQAQVTAGLVTEIQAGLATSAAVATVQADTDDIQARLPAALVTGRMDSSVGAMAANTLTAAAIAADAITAAKVAPDVTTELQAGLATAAALATVQADTDDIQARLPAALVGGKIDATVSGVVSATVTSIAADAITAAAIAAGALDSDAFTTALLNAIADQLLDRAAAIETGLTVRQALRLVASACAGKASGLGTATAIYRNVGDSKDRITATVDTVGNRTAVTTDVT